MKFLITGTILFEFLAFASSREWWERANFYQVYPRSFKDSDGDGIGDLKGIADKMQYLKELGVDGLWLSPIFKSPMKDFGYDISNYTDIQPDYGSVQDVENLVKVCKRLGIKLILDFVPNHTSNEHPWFIASENNETYFRDFYVWSPGKINSTGQRVPPSNWNSLFRFTAWEWSEKRQEYYLHQCATFQPDLNYRNPNVVSEMKNVLLYWLDKGIDGFRVDAIPYIFETMNSDGTFPDEPMSGLCSDEEGTCYLNHIYTKDLPQTYDLVYDWREMLENYTKVHGGSEKILMIEAYSSLEKILDFYGDAFGRLGSQIPFNFAMIDNINVNSTPVDYKKQIEAWLDNMPANSAYVPNWVVGNHDQHRVVNRFGHDIDVVNMMVQILPGIAITYYGDEIGMEDNWISYNDTVDILACNMGPENYWSVNRDPARTPMQWDNTHMAGFTKGRSSWLPINSNYNVTNVKSERAKAGSHLNVFKRLIKLRKSKKVLQDGSTEIVADENLLIIKRETEKPKDQLFAVLNFGNSEQNFTATDYFTMNKKLLTATVVSSNSDIKQGKLFRASDGIKIPKDAGIILE